MSTGKMALFLTCALILGAFSFGLLGYAVEYRNGLPLDDSLVDSENHKEKMETAAAGAFSAVEIARKALESGETGEGGYALDAAYRITEVAEHAASGMCKLRFMKALEAVKHARRHLHNGSAKRAVKKLETAAKELKTACRGIRMYETRKRGPAKNAWDKFQGVELINAQGVRIGELVEITGSGRPTARLRLGSRDVFGFWDFGGKAFDVPADRLIYGKPKTIGSTIVCLPVYNTAGNL